MLILKGHDRRVLALSYSPDGTILASGDESGRLCVWEPTTGRLLGRPSWEARRLLDLAFTPSGDRIVVPRDRGSMSILSARSFKAWTYRRPSELGRDGTEIRGLAFGPPGGIFYTIESVSGFGVHLNAWALGPGDGLRYETLVAAEPCLTRRTDTVSLSVSASGDVLAAGTLRGDAVVWVGGPPWEDALRGVFETDGGPPARAVRLSPDGTALAIACFRTVHILDVEAGHGRVALRPRLTLEGHDETITSVAFAPDGLALATTSWDETVRVWDAETGEERQRLAPALGWLHRVAFSPDGMTAAVGGRSGVAVWDLGEGA